MSNRALELAQSLAAFNRDVITFVASCPEEQWRKHCASEDWKVGVVARHIGAGRASIYLNTSRWTEAKNAALKLQGIDASESLIAAFAFLELGRKKEAMACFLHGALNTPRQRECSLESPRPNPALMTKLKITIPESTPRGTSTHTCQSKGGSQPDSSKASSITLTSTPSLSK